MKKVLFCLLLIAGFVANGQVYNNEWIDYNKTYYKFKIRFAGIYRITQTVLRAAGLENIPAEQFQLWRNGVQVPVYTSASSGALGSGGYIEFWVKRPDGKMDNALYRKASYQLCDYYSLVSDSAAYFLTVNPAGGNLRINTVLNETAGNTLSPEPYFMYTLGNYPKYKMNGGKAENVGQLLYSSSYDIGEGFTSPDISPAGSYSITQNNLYVYPSGPDAKLKVAVSGNSGNMRTYWCSVNSNTIITDKTLNNFDYSIDSSTFSSSVIASGSANLVVGDTSGTMVLHKSEITYPRQFNFGGAKSFDFYLPASANKRFLQISNFVFLVPPVLYDLTNGKRYVGDISARPLVKFVIQPSEEAHYILVSVDAGSSLMNVTTLNQRNFINYADPSNQGDYLMITNPLLFNGNGTNPVEEYKNYRSSVAGGAYTAKVYLIEDLTDQFAFGINKHPLGIRNFALFARNKFAIKPKHILLLGKGTTYDIQRNNEATPDINNLNLIPTFGMPASDVMFTADPGSSVPKISIGRISAINPGEVQDYLDKVKEYEAAQAAAHADDNDKQWMKNVLHLVGVSEPGLQASLEASMARYKAIISDTLYGAKVTTISKQTGNAVEQISGVLLQHLFTEGMGLMTYFGHSGSTTLSFNLDQPDTYNNKGKYPLFLALGCNVGYIFDYATSRYSVKQSLSEMYVLAPGRGTIGFIASSHFGIVYVLDNWAQHAYKAISYIDYGKPIGEILNNTAARIVNEVSEESYFERCNIEQTCYHGDPAITLNTFSKPDYIVNDQLVTISPGFVSIAQTSFEVKAKFINVGKAINKEIVVEIKREFPNHTTQIVYKGLIKALTNSDSVVLTLPVDPKMDKGLNRITVTVDLDNAVDEQSELNNTVTKDVYIYEDEVRPIYPYNFAIVNDPNVKLAASTANTLSLIKNYKIEIDTTELFNSPLKVSKTLLSIGGVLEFSPDITLIDKTVYYWRVALVPTTGEYHWNGFSFIYLKDYETGFNQSHLYQHWKSEEKKMYLDSTSRNWIYRPVLNEILVKNATWITATKVNEDTRVLVNDANISDGGCNLNEVIFNVLDGVTMKPWKNSYSASGGLYHSLAHTCGNNRENNFAFLLGNSTSRKYAMDFIDMIPDGSYVIVRNNNNSADNGNTYSNEWRKDTAIFGSNISLYHKFLYQGITTVDSFSYSRSFIYVFKKNGQDIFPSTSKYTKGIYDKIALTAYLPSPDSSGGVVSPVFGPAEKWKNMLWDGHSSEVSSNDVVDIRILGIKVDGNKDALFKGITFDSKSVDISSIDAKVYPYVQLQLLSTDAIHFTPMQLDYWRLTYDPVPEGALAPNIYFSMKDSVESGDNINFKMAFKNVSKTPFDSLKINIVITDRNNVAHPLPIVKQRPLPGNDTLLVSFSIDSRQFGGNNTLYVDVNPDNDQPEQFHFNNFAYHNFYVNQDRSVPLIDVTFDNIHILNGDIVSSKPYILVKMKDESAKMMLNDSSLLTVKVRYPDNTIRTFKIDNDTLRFTPATVNSDNTTALDFYPYFPMDGEYELIAFGEDKSGNKTGDYRVSFQVINKPMISNLLNYPNPFTSSTAFVFTLTGSEVPQNMRIQILTVTGKVVREITQQELGPIRIGRNLTEFKWDGTDQYGQKLANGVYLYRVLTSLNGKSLDKYKADGDNTDKYFNKGYGKMYLMR